MSYKRKTRDYWDLEADYGHGWEVVTAADTFKEIQQLRKEYRENEPGVPFRIKKRREKLDTSETP